MVDRGSILRGGSRALAVTAVLGVLIVAGSRDLAHFDAALAGYTFATLFAAFGITYRYATWLQRPPARNVSIDPVELEQIVMNLVLNARDAMH